MNLELQRSAGCKVNRNWLIEPETDLLLIFRILRRLLLLRS